MKHYIRSSMHGWSQARATGLGTVVLLPEYLRVEMHSQQDDTGNFTVIEGIRRNQRFSMGVGQLGFGDPGYTSAAELLFRRQEHVLRYRRKGGKQWREVQAYTHPDTPVPVGLHPIQIPDFPHIAMASEHTPYDRSWFYLKRGAAVPGNDRQYLLPGAPREECINITPEQWTELYRFLIRCRNADNETVGEIMIEY